MRIVERGPVLGVLEEAAASAVTGQGSLTFLAGEAGIGKTAVVTTFVSAHRGKLWTLVGACDPLTTPRPLGPLRDMAEASPEISGLFDGRPRHELFARFLELVSTPGRPSVVVFEDVHWADAATLDLLRFVGRRAADTHAVVVATYRSNEIGVEHPLRAILGDLATVPAVRRQSLVPLTPDGVASLAAAVDADVDVAELYRRTGGNPFFVTEVLADPTATLPDNVRDAVLARRNRLPGPSRQVLDAVAVVPGAMERWLLDAVAFPDPGDVDACITAGMLHSGDRGELTFRHELARLAVESAIPPARRADLHARVVRALIEARSVDPAPARIVHHADAAGDREVVLRYAPQAAEAATERGAYHQARDQLDRALKYAETLPDAERADLLERFSSASNGVGDAAAAVTAAEQAVDLRRQGDDELALGAAVRLRGTARWEAGRGPEARADIEAAIELLEPLGETPALAAAYASAVTLAMLARDYHAALELGRTAVDLTDRLGAYTALSRSLNSLGATEILIGRFDDGEAHLLRSIEVAREARDPLSEAVALSNLGSGFGEVRRYDRAERYLEQAISFADAHDLDGSASYSTSWLARVCFETGRWDRAAELATSVPGDGAGMPPYITITALTVLGRLRARRGDPGVDDALDRAWELALETDDLQRLWPVAAARAEAAWLEGTDHAVAPRVGETFAMAVEIGHPWAIGELGLLLSRTGGLDTAGREAVEDGAADPYQLHVAGRIEEAATAWAELGCAYEQADALADGDEDSQRRALEILDELGATPAAARLRQRMRDAGIRSIPRGPRPATAEHPAGLTPRETEVLELVAEGMTNAEIAETLFISEKTVGHHVSSVLGKLGVGSRHDAVRVLDES
ncbi:MAG: LuxR C-terminal-related transcriptional regulator [Nitriliruptorales bacterium]|nr:LuxR C-terminal-related transcriptional regulator [Nitriliruptorales bacterium]